MCLLSGSAFSQGVMRSEAAGLCALKAVSHKGTKSRQGHRGEKENDEKMPEHSLREIIPSMVSRKQIKINQTKKLSLPERHKSHHSLNAQGHKALHLIRFIC